MISRGSAGAVMAPSAQEWRARFLKEFCIGAAAVIFFILIRFWALSTVAFLFGLFGTLKTKKTDRENFPGFFRGLLFTSLLIAALILFRTRFV